MIVLFFEDSPPWSKNRVQQKAERDGVIVLAMLGKFVTWFLDPPRSRLVAKRECPITEKGRLDNVQF